MSTQEAPHLIDRLYGSDTLQALADSRHTPVQLFGLAAQESLAVAAGVIDVVDERVGRREDEYGVPFMDRLASRAYEKTEVIEQPLLREVASETIGAAYLGYVLADNVTKFAQNRVGKLTKQPPGNIKQ